MMRATIAFVLTMSISSLAYLLPNTAGACGGTFCDAGPQAMAVDQTGEKVLFVMATDKVEAHIQIQYDPNTDATQFAWVIPLLAVPDFSVGSDALFDNLLQATVPTYGFQQQFDGCGGTDSAGSGASGGGTDGIKFDLGADDGPQVVLEEQVGAFEIAVLQGGNADEVVQWLADNGYQQDPAALPILAEYLAENYLFAAFKLRHGAGLDEIHPVVLTFPTGEACVPLRLTRIAAVEDMDVRTFFLADHRVVPENYKHVLVNPLRIDWVGLGANYKELISMAVDHAAAEGRAFVTEYAGPSSVVSTVGLYDTRWKADAFATMGPVAVVDELTNQGLMYCGPWGGSSSGGDTGDGYFCQYSHLLLRGLLSKYLPVPSDMSEAEFYSCLACHEDLIDGAAWNGAAFAADMRERIVAPGRHAMELLATWPHLTRMYTTISPYEMTQDPFFHENPDLPDVDLRNSIATRRTLCNGADVWILPDGREVYVPSGGGWPTFDGEMPWVEEVEQMPAKGSPFVLADLTAVIDAELAKWNCRFDWPSAPACGGTESETDTGSDSDDSPGSASAGENEGDMTARGCACVAEGRHTPGVGSLALVVLGLGVGALKGRGSRRTAAT